MAVTDSGLIEYDEDGRGKPAGNKFLPVPGDAIDFDSSGNLIHREQSRDLLIQGFHKEHLLRVNPTFTFGMQTSDENPYDAQWEEATNSLDLAIHNLKHSPYAQKNTVFCHEYGCSGGRFSAEIAKHVAKSFNYTCSDRVPEANDIMQRFLSEKKLHPPEKFFLDVPPPLTTYHLFVAFDVFEYFKPLTMLNVLKKACQLVDSRNGQIMFTYACERFASQENYGEKTNICHYHNRADLLLFMNMRGFDLIDSRPVYSMFGSELLHLRRR